jgi:GNAT superfamily N-acetyltransferase
MAKKKASVKKVRQSNEEVKTSFNVKPLNKSTWPDFARLVERHNGVWGGCWCLAFHPNNLEKGKSPEGNRALKEKLVKTGHAHAALVFDGDVAVGWCQYGTPNELPNIYHRKEYEEDLVKSADYRLTCFFIDKAYRRKGVSAIALQGALELIAEAGGGVVEGYPQDTKGQKTSASFLYNGTRSLFEQAGFRYERSKGKNHCVMSKTVAPSSKNKLLGSLTFSAK